MLTKQNARLHSNKERFARRINSSRITLEDYIYEKYKSYSKKYPIVYQWIAHVDMEGVP